MDCFASTAQLLRPKKKAKLEHLSSITIGYLASRDGSRKAKHWKRMKILFDSGCAATLVNHELVSNLRQTRDQKTKWRTKAGKFTTTNKCSNFFREANNSCCSGSLIVLQLLATSDKFAFEYLASTIL